MYSYKGKFDFHILGPVSYMQTCYNLKRKIVLQKDFSRNKKAVVTSEAMIRTSN